MKGVCRTLKGMVGGYQPPFPHRLYTYRPRRKKGSSGRCRAGVLNQGEISPGGGDLGVSGGK